MHLESIVRNKRLLLVYHECRLRLIIERQKSFVHCETDTMFSVPEHEFAKIFEKIIKKYFGKIGLGCLNVNVPLRFIVVQVLVTSDIGEVFFSLMGTIKLKKNSAHTLPRNDIEPFLRNGKL